MSEERTGVKNIEINDLDENGKRINCLLVALWHESAEIFSKEFQIAKAEFWTPSMLFLSQRMFEVTLSVHYQG